MPETAAPKPERHSGSQRVTLAVLAALVLATVFLLPQLISEPLLFGEDPEQPVVPAPPNTAVSPSTAAEKTKYRQDAQRVLAQFVAVRDRLQEQNVESWAGAEFGQGMKMIEAGDQQYHYGEYKASLVHYEQALALFERLQEEGEEKLARALADGAAAIEDLNPNIASAAGQVAQSIAPDDPAVQGLAARIAVLPEVATRVEAGELARSRGDLEGARAAFQEALALDPQHQRASEALSTLAQDITESRFRAHMSRALAALESGDWPGARAAFADADAIHPGHAAVKQGLAQLENRKSHARVHEQVVQAGRLESQEQWQEALTIYQGLLDEDPSLTQARVKLIPAEVRARLDAQLTDLLEDPLQLSGQDGYRRGQAVLQAARGIQQPGPRLREQIGELEELLVAAVSFVDVEFRSDNATHVTLFRVAELGQFESTSVRLRPGKYVAAGTRKGFRDVRVEFIVSGKAPGEPVVVRCEEPI